MFICGVTGADFCYNTGLLSIDYDLTKMSKTVVNAQINNINSSPSSYVNKTIKITGSYVGGAYPMVSVGYDAKGCCQVGLEFVLANGNYPTEGSQITVTGTLQTYYEGDQLYCHLVNASLVR